MIVLGIELLLNIIITTWPCIKKLHTNLQVTLIEHYHTYFVHSGHHYPSRILFIRIRCPLSKKPHFGLDFDRYNFVSYATGQNGCVDYVVR